MMFDLKSHVRAIIEKETDGMTYEEKCNYVESILSSSVAPIESQEFYETHKEEIKNLAVEQEHEKLSGEFAFLITVDGLYCDYELFEEQKFEGPNYIILSHDY